MIDQCVHPVYIDLQNAFQNYANRIAIIDKDGTAHSYSEFEATILGAYDYLTERGIKKGSKILVAVPMSFELYAILEAIFAIGATAIFLDPWMKGKKMGAIIRQVKPDLFIVTKKLSRITWLLIDTWRLKKWRISGIRKSENNSLQISTIYASSTINNNDNALITFTSGTSGEPKGANRTYGFLHAQAETLKAHLTCSKNSSVDYTNFPIVGLANFALGNTVAIPQLNLMKLHKSNANEIIEQLRLQKIERLIVSPSLLRKALDKIDEKHTIKTIMTGGAPISIRLVRNGIKKCPSVNFEAIYGSTEAEPICITTFTEIDTKLAEPLKGIFVGAPVPEIRLKIIEYSQHNDNGLSTNTFHKSMLPEGQIGEIVVTGNHVNKNYFENAEAFKKNKIVDNENEIWHRTGDMGYIENGLVYIVGRDHRIMYNDQMIIHPYPIEQFIELEFGISDIGYVQNTESEFCLYYYNEQNINESAIKKAIQLCGYPIDKIVKSKKPLPRDARHQSKLQLEKLIF